MKAVKIIFAFLLSGLILFQVGLFFDDPLNPEINRIETEYTRPADLNENAYIALLNLGNNKNYGKPGNRFNAYLSGKTNRITPALQPINYPDIKQFRNFDDLELLCDFDKHECLDKIKKKMEEAKQLTSDFKDILTKYRSLAKLNNYMPINISATEPNFDQLNNLSKLAMLDVYIDIIEKNYDVAVSKLVDLIRIDRKFMASSNRFVFGIMPIVNMQKRYKPIILRLIKEKDNNLQPLLSILNPLTDAEFTMNRFYLANFANGIEQIELKNIAYKQIEEDPLLGKLLAQRTYKQNMTLNEIFRRLKIYLIPDNFQKKNLPFYLDEKQLIKEREDGFDETSEFSVNNLRNPVGEMMLVIKGPPMVDIYEDEMKLDLELLLLRIIILAKSNDIQVLIGKNEFKNPYNGKKASVKEKLLCYTMDNDICVPLL